MKIHLRTLSLFESSDIGFLGGGPTNLAYRGVFLPPPSSLQFLIVVVADDAWLNGLLVVPDSSNVVGKHMVVGLLLE